MQKMTLSTHRCHCLRATIGAVKVIVLVTWLHRQQGCD